MTKQTSYRLPTPTKTQIEELAAKLDTTEVNVLTIAIRELYAKETEKETMSGDYLRYSIPTGSDYYGTEPSVGYFERVESEVREFMAKHYPGVEVDVDRHPETSSYNTRSAASDEKMLEDVEAFVDRYWVGWLAEESE